MKGTRRGLEGVRGWTGDGVRRGFGGRTGDWPQDIHIASRGAGFGRDPRVGERLLGRKRHFDLRETARHSGVRCGGDRLKILFDEPPRRLSKDDNRNSSAGKVLLVAKVLVRCHQEPESSIFGHLE